MNTWKLGGAAAVLVAAGLLWWLQSGQEPQPGIDGAETAGGTRSAEGAVGGARSADSRAGGGASAGGGVASRGAAGGGAGGRPSALVVARPVTEALINDRLKAVGSGTALASVSVVPLSSGLLSDVLVSSGQRVERGDTLALLDDEEQLIARDRAARNVDNLAIDEARLAKLYRSRTTTEVELIRARADLADARLALREAELTLARRRITAPIAGIVGLVAVDKGNYVSTQTEIVTIDDRSTIILEFWVPERFASQIAVGQTLEATAQANPSRPYTGTITGIGSRVESNSRTLPVEARVENDDDSLRPGMAFNITLNFTGQRYPAVDPLAIQWDSKGSYVWQIAEDKVQRMPVQIIQRNPESVLVASELAVGDQVVIEGLMSLRPGASVRVQGGGRAPGGARNGDEKTARTTAGNSAKTSTGQGADAATNSGADANQAARP